MTSFVLQIAKKLFNLLAQYRTSYILLCNTLYKTSVYVNNLEKTLRSQIVSNLCKNLKNPSNFSNVSLSQQTELSKMLSKNSINCVRCLNTVLVIREVKFHLVGATNGSFLAVPLATACAPPILVYSKSEVESATTSLASRTHFEVLGLGLEGQVLGLWASSSRKLACPRLEDSTFFFNS